MDIQPKFKINRPDNFVTVVFVKGTNGEGARRGRKGQGDPLGEISGRMSSLFLSIKTGSLR